MIQAVHAAEIGDAALRGDAGAAEGDPVVTALREQVTTLVKTVDPRLTIHDFRIVPGATHTNLIFDVVIPFDEQLTRPQVAQRVCRLVEDMDGHYRAVVKIENSYVE